MGLVRYFRLFENHDRLSNRVAALNVPNLIIYHDWGISSIHSQTG
jgi:hypothetical protein